MSEENLKSGQKFRHKNGTLYTLQKLPDVEMWILVTEHGGLSRQWCEVSRTAEDAFGGWRHIFKLEV